MRFELILAPHVAAAVRALPEPLQRRVLDHPDRLERNPSDLGRSAPCPPFVAGCTMTSCACNFPGGLIHTFTILYKYGDDERTLHAVGCSDTTQPQ